MHPRRSVLVKNSPEAAGYPPVELAQPESLGDAEDDKPQEEMGVWENLAKNVRGEALEIPFPQP